MLKSNFHTHTNEIQPWECNYDAKTLIDECVKLNFEVLSITEHAKSKGKVYPNTITSYKKVKDYAKKKEILLIPGVELNINDGHVLAINFSGDPSKFTTFDDLEKLKQENVFIIAAHPFFKKKSIGNSLITNIKLFDAIEHSHYYTKHINFNKKAIEVANKYNKPLISNSDAHLLYQLNWAYSFIDADKNTDSVLEALRKNKIKNYIKPLSYYQFSRRTATLIIKNFKKHFLY